jgi:hypothetical protein
LAAAQKVEHYEMAGYMTARSRSNEAGATGHAGFSKLRRERNPAAKLARSAHDDHVALQVRIPARSEGRGACGPPADDHAAQLVSFANDQCATCDAGARDLETATSRSGGPARFDGNYVTGITEDQLKDAPAFSDDSWSDRNWETQTYNHYKVSPYW